MAGSTPDNAEHPPASLVSITVLSVKPVKFDKDHQALREAVVRYNAEGLAGLRDRPEGRPPRRLSEGEEATLAAVILRGPDPERDDICAWTRAALCQWMAVHFGKSFHPAI